MTTGSWTVGGPSSGVYARKEWVGADGVMVTLPNGKVVRDKRTPHTYTVSGFKVYRTQSTFQNAWNGQFWSGFTWPPGVFSGSQNLWDANSELKLLEKLRQKIRGHNFNSGVFAAEAPKAVSSIVAAATSVFSAYRYVKRGQPQQAIRALTTALSKSGRVRNVRASLKTTDVSSTWLALQYGWLPLISDVYEGVQMLDHLASRDDGLVFRAQHTEKVDWPYNGPNFSCVFPCSHTVRLICRLKEQPPVLQEFGLENPLSIAWELLPFSFVLDWFVPVGSYLEAMGFFRGLDTSWERADYFRCRSRDPHEGDSYPWMLYSAGQFEESHYSFTRSLGTTIDVPTPTLKEWARVASKSHLQNAAALVTNLVARNR